MKEYPPNEEIAMNAERAESDKELLAKGAEHDKGKITPTKEEIKRLHEEGENKLDHSKRLKSPEFVQDRDSVMGFIDQESRFVEQGAIDAQMKLRELENTSTLLLI